MSFNDAIRKAIRWRKRWSIISVYNRGTLWVEFDACEGVHRDPYLVLDQQRLQELSELEKHDDLLNLYITKLLRKMEVN